LTAALESSAEILLFERTLENGELERWSLAERGMALAVRAGASGAPERTLLPLPESAVGVVMRRYGRPLEEAVHGEGPALPLEDGASLSRFRYLARFDVIGLDYLLYRAPGGEPLAAPAAPVTAALRHLASRAEGGGLGR
jgi:hypothetical protein